ncbi:MAG TPA: hypothetical protein VNG90_04450 [Candidatus Acidoferrum sp.]|nr:hypothetical protein [Candidatus Acidoferrum sp.]
MQIKQITIAANWQTGDTVIRRVLSENMPFELSEQAWQELTKQSGYEQAVYDVDGMLVSVVRLKGDITLSSLNCTAYSELGAQSLFTVLSDLVRRSFTPAEADGVWVKAYGVYGHLLSAFNGGHDLFTARLRDFRYHNGKMCYVVHGSAMTRHDAANFPLSWEQFKEALTDTLWQGKAQPHHWVDYVQPNASLITDVMELLFGGLWEFGHNQLLLNQNTGTAEPVGSTCLLQTAIGETLEPRPEQEVLAVITRHDIWNCPFWTLLSNGLLMIHADNGSVVVTKEPDSIGVSVSQLIAEIEQRFLE